MNHSHLCPNSNEAVGYQLNNGPYLFNQLYNSGVIKSVLSKTDAQIMFLYQPLLKLVDSYFLLDFLVTWKIELYSAKSQNVKKFIIRQAI